MLASHIQRYAYPWLALAVLLIVADTCPHTTYTSSAQVAIFEDTNANGKLDRGELAIPNTLIVAEYNTYGAFFRSAVLADANGQATLKASYTNFFNVIVVPPCGYRPTTDTRFDAKSQSKIQAGFVSESPATGMATLQFHLWDDLDGDGRQGAGEPALDSFYFSADPLEAGAQHMYQGVLSAQTDSQGQAVLDLGNSCSTLWVRPSVGWTTSVITSSSEASSSEAPPGEEQDGWWAIAYGPGDTAVEWGLRQTQSPPTPAATSTSQ